MCDKTHFDNTCSVTVTVIAAVGIISPNLCNRFSFLSFTVIAGPRLWLTGCQLCVYLWFCVCIYMHMYSAAVCLCSQHIYSLLSRCAFETHKWKAHYSTWFILICRELVWRRKKLWHRTEQTSLLSLNWNNFVLWVCLCRVAICVYVFFLSFFSEEK